MNGGRGQKAFSNTSLKKARKTGDVGGAFAQALTLHQNGRVADAQTLYKEVLRILPNHFDALHLLGVSECQIGHLDAAERFIKRALVVNPRSAAAHSNLGNVLIQSGRFDEALASFDRAITLKADYVEAFFNKGNALGALRRFDGAVASYDRAIALKPDYAEAFGNRGNALRELQRPAEALESCDKAIALRPNFVEAMNNRANALRELDRLDEALAGYGKVIALKPDFAEAYRNRGITLLQLERVEEALANFDMAIALNTNSAALYFFRGNSLIGLDRPTEALESLDRAIELDPDHADAFLKRGNVLRQLRRFDEALASYDRALTIKSDLADAWIGRAIILGDTRLAESIVAWNRALAVEPDSTMVLAELGLRYASQGNTQEAIAYCDRALAIDPEYDRAISFKIFILDFAPHAGFGQQQEIRRYWWQKVGSKATARPPVRHANGRDPSRRIVLGYVSSDFRAHSAAIAFLAVLQRHDKEKFKVVCYSCSSAEDDMTAGFREVADTWRSASKSSDDELADQVQADGIDILIDLSGHSGGHRLRAFARKPAPIQVTGWGSGNGTGIPMIDYLLSDPVAIPAAARHLFAERVYDLPCLSTMEPPPSELRFLEPPVLSRKHITFGVFNRIGKISDDAVTVWARILQSDPRSRLLIKNQDLDDDSIRAMLRRRFAGRGVSQDRVDLVGSTTREEHLLAYGNVDICLDPFPQNGGISTWEALHMGVPVVAKLGNSVPSRLSGAILSAIGMGEWVADSSDGYADIAVKYASMPDCLGEIRRDLRARIAASAAGNPVSYVKDVEKAYRAMWEEYCKGADRPLELIA